MLQADTLTDAEIFRSLRDTYRGGYSCLTIFSRRQDIGIQKCEWGVEHGYLTREVVEINEQETHWRYKFTAKAKEEWSEDTNVVRTTDKKST